MDALDALDYSVVCVCACVRVCAVCVCASVCVCVCTIIEMHYYTLQGDIEGVDIKTNDRKVRGRCLLSIILKVANTRRDALLTS